MILQFCDICRIAQGAVRIRENGSLVELLRFTEAQEDLYRNTSRDFYEKTFATAGIRLSFVTDSGYVRLRYRLSRGSSRYYGWFDVYENGILVNHFGSTFADSVEGDGLTTLSSGEKRVDIYFPWSAAAQIRELELSDGAMFRPVPRKRKMIAYGDSITHGYDAQYPSLSYQNQVADILGAECVNKGIGAEKFFPPLPDGAADPNAEMITVAYGTNDWDGRSREEFTENCRKFYENLVMAHPNARIFAITPIWRGDTHRHTLFAGSLRESAELITEICEAFPTVKVIRGDTLTPHYEGFYSPDVVHPNDLGFHFYGQNLGRALLRELGE